MKTNQRIMILGGMTFLCFFLLTLWIMELLYCTSTIRFKNKEVFKVGYNEELASENEVEIVYDDMTLEELAAKLDRSLNSTLENTGYLFASYALELGVDPYLAVAIVLHETGCTNECSYLVRACNNVGGQKGSPSCNGGSYMRYDTLEEGIKGFLNNLYRGYISKGYTTPEQIGPKYAVSTTWASKINWYINDLKAND